MGDDASFLKERSDVIKQNMISRLYDQNTGRFYDGLTEAGGCGKPLCPACYRVFAGVRHLCRSGSVGDRMSATIVADGTIRMSVYGSYFLLDGLYQSGSGTLARSFMSNPDTQYSSNSWAYMLKKLGATMSTEAWSPEAKREYDLFSRLGIFSRQPNCSGNVWNKTYRSRFSQF